MSERVTILTIQSTGYSNLVVENGTDGGTDGVYV